MSLKGHSTTLPDAVPASSLDLKAALQYLHANPSPHVPNPVGCTKRASVALVIRVRPPPQQRATYNPERCTKALPFDESLTRFFGQEWVQRSEPEVLFIKRAARVGDRWTGQIAFPGGKKDPQDADDAAASIRETLEETGLDLESEWCLQVGNLPQRVITVAWGKKPLMVLCPFVFLLLRFDIPPLNLQPAEVHSAHWVPLKCLLSTNLRTNERADVSDRAPGGRSPAIRALFRTFGGQLMFSAVMLLPSESLFCDNTQDKILPEPAHLPLTSESLNASSQERKELHSRQNLVLWGLTLGMISDFLQLLDLKGTQRLWSWPTFSHWDIRFYVWLLTRKYRNQKAEEENAVHEPVSPSSGNGRLSGVDSTSTAVSVRPGGKGLGSGLAGAHHLDSYFENMKQAIILAIATRLVGGLALVTWILRKRRR